MTRKIVSIEIELKDYEPIKFTMDEAKELYEQLHSIFGPKTVDHHHYYPWWNRPYYTWYSTVGSENSTYTVSSANTSAVGIGNITTKLLDQTVASTDTGMEVTYK